MYTLKTCTKVISIIITSFLNFSVLFSQSKENILSFPSQTHSRININLMDCILDGPDKDNDNIPDRYDKDDDNDGILDINEVAPEALEVYINTGQFTIDLYNIGTNVLNNVCSGMTNLYGDIAIDASGQLYGISLTDPNPSAIYYIDLTTCSETLVLTLSNVAGNSLSFLPNGDLLVGYASTSRVDVINLASNTVSTWHDFGFGNASGDFIYLEGKIYVSWVVSNENHLFEINIDSDFNYISHLDLGILPTTFGMGLTCQGIVSGGEDRLFLITPDSPPIIEELNYSGFPIFGITGLAESNLAICDTDMDGVPNFKDLDSDNDGIPDAIEACGDISLILEDCMLDSDGSGLYFDIDGDDCIDGILDGACLDAPIDTDQDGLPDFIDLDSDNDGCADAIEAGTYNDGTSINDYIVGPVDDCGLLQPGISSICPIPDSFDWIDIGVLGNCCPEMNSPYIFTCSVILGNNVSCNGSDDGSATVLVQGGISPYEYLWSSGEITSTANTLTAGTQFVTVTDSNLCSTSCEIQISEPEPINCSLSLINAVSCFGATDASVSVSVVGGTPPYTFLWDNGETTSVAVMLSSGSHSVTVTDVNGCCN